MSSDFGTKYRLSPVYNTRCDASVDENGSLSVRKPRFFQPKAARDQDGSRKTGPKTAPRRMHPLHPAHQDAASTPVRDAPVSETEEPLVDRGNRPRLSASQRFANGWMMLARSWSKNKRKTSSRI
ncbi:hypothetical protein BHE90_009865 [Fusarium euwallaceae]|uniref:Uncharacterized protein n=2 Tax=Fusarium solani species complex TaxID=232080 RepID=A0A3M2S4T8_9HYPO|nr:hypothetical protein CDV36_007808 [Fusarium kuroshium]RTE75669.1 hypothetical protein BHE90_009865 [Fusarium euwallaceae]